jgi:hypothetical protein
VQAAMDVLKEKQPAAVPLQRAASA